MKSILSFKYCFAVCVVKMYSLAQCCVEHLSHFRDKFTTYVIFTFVSLYSYSGHLMFSSVFLILDFIQLVHIALLCSFMKNNILYLLNIPVRSHISEYLTAICVSVQRLVHLEYHLQAMISAYYFVNMAQFALL